MGFITSIHHHVVNIYYHFSNHPSALMTNGKSKYRYTSCFLQWTQTWGGFTSWWLNQPIWKICSSNWVISPGIGMNIKKCLSCHHLGVCGVTLEGGPLTMYKWTYNPFKRPYKLGNWVLFLTFSRVFFGHTSIYLVVRPTSLGRLGPKTGGPKLQIAPLLFAPIVML